MLVQLGANTIDSKICNKEGEYNQKQMDENKPIFQVNESHL